MIKRAAVAAPKQQTWRSHIKGRGYRRKMRFVNLQVNFHEITKEILTQKVAAHKLF